ncbi:MAG: glycosyltransferase family 39 protein [Bacteroidota bacterium]
MQHTAAIRISLLALVASLAFSLLVFPLISETQRANSDPDRFGQLALNIAQGNGFVYEKGGAGVLERTPLYPYIVAGLFKLNDGFSVASVQILQAVLHAITSFVVYLIGLRIYARRTAILAQTVFALHPIAIWYTARIWAETTHTLLLMFVGLALMILLESLSLKRSFLVGLIFGLSCLTKSILLLFPILLLGFLTGRFRSQGMKYGIVVIVAMLAIIFPWTLRNFQISRHVVPVNTSLGFNLIQGDVIGEQWPSENKYMLDYWVAGETRANSILAPYGVPWESGKGDQILCRTALNNYAREPLFLVRRLVANFCTFWHLSESLAKSLLFGIAQMLLMLAACVSSVQMPSAERRTLAPLIALLLYYILVNVAVMGIARYSMPTIPFLLIIAAPLIDKVFFHRTA